MTTNDSKVKRLLDGDIDEEEIASDPVLASMAERIFGLNIEPITPTKPSLSDGLSPVEVITAKTTHDSMLEVVPGVEPIPMPMPLLPNIPKGEDSKKGKFLMIFGISSLLLAVANIFGACGFLNGGEGTRINWAGIHDINNEMGWSEAYPVLGIPDYVAVVASILVLIVAFVRK